MDYNYYLIELAREAKREKAREKQSSRRPMTANEWRFNDYGSAEPRNSSFDTIFEAYNDYRVSQQWN